MMDMFPCIKGRCKNKDSGVYQLKRLIFKKEHKKLSDIDHD